MVFKKREYSTAAEAEAQWKEMQKSNFDLLDMAKVWHEDGETDLDLAMIFNVESDCSKKWWIELRAKVKAKLIEMVTPKEEAAPEKSWVVTTFNRKGDRTSFDFKQDEEAAKAQFESTISWWFGHTTVQNLEGISKFNPTIGEGVRIEYKKWPE
jgi:hypothetical protein